MENNQLTSAGKIVLDKDHKLKPSEINKLFLDLLEPNDSMIKIFNGQKKYITFQSNGKTKIILFRNITYMGNPHPSDKKRIQIPTWFQDLYFKLRPLHDEVILIGVYTYDDNIIFADFNIEHYIQNKTNNSSAHISINDLQQAFVSKYFVKEDHFNNMITIINKDNIYEYLTK